MKIGFGFYGITKGTDKRTGYSRDYKHCWNNIQEMLVKPFVEQGHTPVTYASTYHFENSEDRDEFYSTVNPHKVVFSNFQGSDAFTAKSALHECFIGENLDAVVFTRFDIHFSKVIAHEPNLDFNKVNFLFPEDPVWWKSHNFTCDCFYIWNHKYSDRVRDAMRQTYGWPRGVQYPDTHGMINFLVKTVPLEEMNFISKDNEISNVNTFYTLCRPDVPQHPCFHPDVKEKYGK